jgi:hypothetical protein
MRVMRNNIAVTVYPMLSLIKCEFWRLLSTIVISATTTMVFVHGTGGLYGDCSVRSWLLALTTSLRGGPYVRTGRCIIVVWVVEFGISDAYHRGLRNLLGFWSDAAEHVSGVVGAKLWVHRSPDANRFHMSRRTSFKASSTFF